MTHEFKSQEEVIEKMRDDNELEIKCSSIEEKQEVGRCIGIKWNRKENESIQLYIYVYTIKQLLGACGGIDKEIITGAKFLALPKSKEKESKGESGAQRTKHWIETMYDKFHPKELVIDISDAEADNVSDEISNCSEPRVVIDGAIKTSKEWKTFEDIHSKIRKIALNAKSGELKKLVKYLKGFIDDKK